MLVLPIQKKWFKMILSGEKKEEYREIKPYYDERFRKVFNESGVGEIIFRNGYGKNVPSILCLCVLSKGYGRKEWGAKPGQEYYVLSIESVEEIF